MGGADIYFEVTLSRGLGGSDPDALFDLRVCFLTIGQEKPKTMPYGDPALGLTHQKLVAEVPYVGNTVGQKASELTLQNPVFEHKYTRNMSI